MYNISVGVGPGGKYISRNIQKGVLSNVIIILRHIYDVCMRCLGDVSRGVCEVTRASCLISVVAAVL